MSTMMEAFYDWIALEGPQRQRNFHRYFAGVAQARFVIRNILRIVDEQARKAGLEPLQHQALIQVFGASEPLQVNDVAARLGIAPAFASRLVRELENQGCITRSASDRDRRVTLVAATPEGERVLAEIDESVHLHVEYFQSQLSEEERAAALVIFAFYVGASPELKELAQHRKVVAGSLDADSAA
jgi:DNA-binding MarR family transcriptional regulator